MNIQGKTLVLTPILVFCLFWNTYSQTFWQQLNCPDSITVRAVKVNSNGDIFFSAANPFSLPYQGGVYRSSDQGASWVNTVPYEYGDVYGLDIDSYGNIFMGHSSSIFKSSDNGDTWTPVYTHTGGNFFPYRLKAGFDSIILMGGSHTAAIIRSGDHGTTWRIVYSLPVASQQWITDFVFTNDHQIYASSVHPENGHEVFFKSMDYGNTWIPLSPSFGPNTAGFYSINVDLDGNILLGSLGDGLSRYYADPPPGYCVQLTPATTVMGIMVLPTNQYYLANSINGSGFYGGCYIYDNLTGSFTPQNSGLIGQFFDGITHDNEGHLLIFGNGGIYRSDSIVYTDVSPTTHSLLPSFYVFPNPCTDYFLIAPSDSQQNSVITQITMFGSNGMKYVEKSGCISIPFRIDMSRFPSGLYYISIANESFHHTFTLLHFQP